MLQVLDGYADAVVRGRELAGKYHRLACERHQRDRRRENTKGFPYLLDGRRVERFVQFAQQLKHYKGEWARRPIVLERHQVFRLGSILGWVHRDTGYRRFRNAYIELPRKNGKSLEDAVMALYVTFFDGEPGAEGYCAATKREQAKIVWGDCRRLVLSSGLKTRIQVLRHNLSREATAQKLEPLGADVDSHDGLNAHFVSLDELHKYKQRDRIDVLETATGARRQPLIFKITTAGDDMVSPCGVEHTYACQVLDRTHDDETYFAFIAHAEPTDDPWDVRTWRKANPNYGISVKPDDLHAKAQKAQHMPEAAATFKQKHLNLWGHPIAPWLSLDGWIRGQHDDWTADDLEGQPCWAGVDLASKLDLMALVLVFPPPADGARGWRILRWVWTPEETLDERADRDRAPYRVWADAGLLLTQPGTSMDPDIIRDVLAVARTHYDIQAIGFDPWHAYRVTKALVQEDGFDERQVLEVRQTFQGMSAGCKDLEAAVLAAAVDAGGCPLMQWTFGNAVVNRDEKDNIYPTKRKSRGRIDPLTATCVAWNLILRAQADQPADDPDLVVA